MADKAAAPAAPVMREAKTLTLAKSGFVVVYDADFSTSDVIAAQKASGKDTSMFSLYLAQRIATFDGARLTMGDIREKIRGRDYLQLTAAILGSDDGGDDEGK